MTVKEASVRFKIEEKEIRQRKKDDMIINVYKEGRNIIIPDDTAIIPSKKDVKAFLLQIIKFKNNSSAVISRELCPDSASLKELMNYLYQRGFIGEYIFNENIQVLFANVSLTDSGIDYVIGKNSVEKLNDYKSKPLQLNPNLNLSLIRVG